MLGVAVSAAMLLDMVMLSSGMRASFRNLLLSRGFQIRLAPKGTLPFDTDATIGDATERHGRAARDCRRGDGEPGARRPDPRRPSATERSPRPPSASIRPSRATTRSSRGAAAIGERARGERGLPARERAHARRHALGRRRLRSATACRHRAPNADARRARALSSTCRPSSAPSRCRCRRCRTCRASAARDRVSFFMVRAASNDANVDAVLQRHRARAAARVGGLDGNRDAPGRRATELLPPARA